MDPIATYLGAEVINSQMYMWVACRYCQHQMRPSSRKRNRRICSCDKGFSQVPVSSTEDLVNIRLGQWSREVASSGSVYYHCEQKPITGMFWPLPQTVPSDQSLSPSHVVGYMVVLDSESGRPRPAVLASFPKKIGDEHLPVDLGYLVDAEYACIKPWRVPPMSPSFPGAQHIEDRSISCIHLNTIHSILVPDRCLSTKILSNNGLRTGTPGNQGQSLVLGR